MRQKQAERVLEFIRGGAWYSLMDISRGLGCGTAAIAGRLHELKNKDGHRIERSPVREGRVYLYRLAA
jgi:biotin operon repressor